MTDLNWDAIASTASEALTLLTPVIEAAVPGAAAGIAIATKIANGVIDAEPTAVALYNQIKSGTPPTQDQVKALNDAYEASWKALHDDLTAQIAAAKD